MTSSLESKLFPVIAVPIWSLVPTRIGILKALFDGYLGPRYPSSILGAVIFASGQHVENLRKLLQRRPLSNLIVNL